MKEGYYMVLVDGETAPTVKHETEALAIDEAKRLTKKMEKNSFVLFFERSRREAQFNIVAAKMIQEIKTDRADGHYWVRMKVVSNHWSIARYFQKEDIWHILNMARLFGDDDFEEIDERQITQGWNCQCKSDDQTGWMTEKCCNICGKVIAEKN